jgi:hypothetical protein
LGLAAVPVAGVGSFLLAATGVVCGWAGVGVADGFACGVAAGCARVVVRVPLRRCAEASVGAMKTKLTPNRIVKRQRENICCILTYLFNSFHTFIVRGAR